MRVREVRMHIRSGVVYYETVRDAPYVRRPEVVYSGNRRVICAWGSTSEEATAAAMATHAVCTRGPNDVLKMHELLVAVLDLPEDAFVGKVPGFKSVRLPEVLRREIADVTREVKDV